MEFNKIYNTKFQDWNNFVNKESIDLIFTSPPYDNIRDYNGFTYDYHELGLCVYDMLKPDGVCVMVINDQVINGKKSLTTFKTAIDWEEIGFGLFECCIYQRHSPFNHVHRFRNDHEYILIFMKGDKPKYFNQTCMYIPCSNKNMTVKKVKKNVRMPDNSWRIDTYIRKNTFKGCGTVLKYSPSCTENNKLKLKHPATMPDKLAEDFIKCFSQENDIVLDPMSGSGTTLVMAQKNKRNFIGFEISAEYCNIINERLNREYNDHDITKIIF